jgi:hypothetical protein
VKDLLTLPLGQRLESFRADGDPGLDADAALDGWMQLSTDHGQSS